jgi:hypothetical protein
LLTIENSRGDPFDPSCLSNRSGRIDYFDFNRSNILFLFKNKDNGTGLIFGNSTLSPNSSLMILSGSLQANQVYQFMVFMENRKNSSVQATGYVLVTVHNTYPQLIAIG